MKKTWTLAIILVGLFLIVGIFALKNQNQAVKADGNVDGANSKTTPQVRNAIKSRQVLIRPVPGSVFENKQNTVPSIPPPCLAQWISIASHGLMDLFGDMANEKFVLNPDCLSNDKKLFPEISLAIYSDECKRENVDMARAVQKDRESKAETNLSGKCFNALMFYRALAINKLTENQDPNLLDAPVIMNKMLAQIMEGKLTGPGSDESYNLKLADALISKEPDVYGAYKFKALALFVPLAESQSGNNSVNQDRSDSLRQVITTAESFGQNDPELTELKLVSKKFEIQNEESYARYLREELSDHPESSIVQYYMAGLDWRSGNKDGAQERLRNLIAREPSNKRFSETLAKLKTAKPGDKIFTLVIGVSFETL